MGLEEGMRLDLVVQQVFDMLSEVRLGSVVAVWRDGGVSSHRDLGFRYRVLPSGEREEPVVTFVANNEARSVDMIRERILKASGPTELNG
jgi:hypothetical protein